MPRYEKAGPDVLAIVESMMTKYHAPLRDAGVVVDVLMAFPALDDEGEEKDGPVVVVNGYPCEAKVRVINYRDRVKGCGDAEITIDAKNWELLDGEDQDGLVDHELTHLELKMKVVDEKEVVSRDDLDRPKLKIRRHDYLLGLFDEVVRRHKRHSPEYRTWSQFEEKRVQLWLPYVDEGGGDGGKAIAAGGGGKAKLKKAG